MDSPQRSPNGSPQTALAVVIGGIAICLTAAGAYALIALIALVNDDFTFDGGLDPKADHKVEVRRDGDRLQVGLRVEQETAPDSQRGSTLSFSWEADGNRASFSHESTPRPARTGGMFEMEFDKTSLQRVRGRVIDDK